MEVVLTPDLEDLITRQVDQGNYPSPGEVVRDALRLLKEQLESRDKRLEALKREAEEGIVALERGDYEEYETESLGELLEGIKERGRRCRMKRLPPTQVYSYRPVACRREL